MKLIISRKGFDSTWDKFWFGSGGEASPIFPDGTMYSLPIPDREVGIIEFRDVSAKGKNVGQLVTDLRRGKIPAENLAHLDPDLNPLAYPREKGWIPLFGQAGRAQQHLANQRVDKGDLFLFFGLFKNVVEDSDGHWRYAPGARWQHVLWGWLQIGEKHAVDAIRHDKAYEWARYHPHFQFPPGALQDNTVYIASHTLDLLSETSGAGLFPTYNARLALTNLDQPKTDWQVTRWKLPSWFYPGDGKRRLTYHPSREGWLLHGDYAYVQRKGQGQEYVLDTNEYQEALEWVSSLIREFGESQAYPSE